MRRVYVLAMRAAIVLGIFVAATAPAAAGPAVTTLTLSAPGATAFGHVDFAGRLSPNAPGTRVSLMRGKKVVAATAVKQDGTYRFQVAVGRPGRSTRSRQASRRSRSSCGSCRSCTKLVGSYVVGTPLTLVARLQPGEAGDVRVRVIRDGSYAYRGSFAERARVRLGTASPAPFAVAVDVLPAKATATSERGSASPSARRRSRTATRAIRRDAARPVARAWLRGTLAADGVRLGRAAGRLRLPEGAAARADGSGAAFWRRLARPVEIVPRHRSRRATSRSTRRGRSSWSCATAAPY